MQRLSETPFFGARFRENAGRSLLLPKRKPGKRSPLWALRRRAASLLKVASVSRDFPIVLETYRECLADHFDMAALKTLLNDIANRRIKTVDLTTDVPSPFASSLMFQYVANFIYDGDAPLAERRAQALTIDQSKLRELMGEAALRTLLDAESIQAVINQLQRTQIPANSIDALHSLFLEIGPLDITAVSARYAPQNEAKAALNTLIKDNRVFRYKRGKQELYAAVEDAARLRDAIGIVIQLGFPSPFSNPPNARFVIWCGATAEPMAPTPRKPYRILLGCRSASSTTNSHNSKPRARFSPVNLPRTVSRENGVMSRF